MQLENHIKLLETLLGQLEQQLPALESRWEGHKGQFSPELTVALHALGDLKQHEERMTRVGVQLRAIRAVQRGVALVFEQKQAKIERLEAENGALRHELNELRQQRPTKIVRQLGDKELLRRIEQLGREKRQLQQQLQVYRAPYRLGKKPRSVATRLEAAQDTLEAVCRTIEETLRREGPMQIGALREMLHRPGCFQTALNHLSASNRIHKHMGKVAVCETPTRAAV